MHKFIQLRDAEESFIDLTIICGISKINASITHGISFKIFLEKTNHFEKSFTYRVKFTESEEDEKSWGSFFCRDKEDYERVKKVAEDDWNKIKEYLLDKQLLVIK